MSVQSIARTTTRLAMILLFILALAGCGDSGDDMNAHMDEHDHDEHEHEAGEVIATFDEDNGGFMGGESDNSDNFSQSLKVTSGGRFGFVLQRSGHLAADDPLLADNRIYIVDSGLEVVPHEGHFDPRTVDPTLRHYQLGHGGGEMGYYNPVHFVSHHGLTAIFYDGINPARSSDPATTMMQPGFAVVYRDSDFEDKDRTEPPHPIFELDVEYYSHGAAVAAHEDLFIVTLAEPDGYLPNGVATYSPHDHGDHVDIELEQDFGELCPRLHGEAIWGPYVAFGCVANGDDRYLDDDGNPLIADGILVLTAKTENGDVAESIKYAHSFDATVVAYPLEYTSGGLAATTLHEVGHDDVIFMARYGPDNQDFMKITEHDIDEGEDAEPMILTVETDSTERHRAYAFEPVEGSAARLLVEDQDADGDNLHLDVVELGDMDHDMEGGGHFVVLTYTGDLHIFDLSNSDVPEIVDLGVACLGEDDYCPRLALAPGFAYVSDPAGGKVIEVHLAEAHVEREFEDDLTAPTQIVVLGRYGYELEHEHAR